MMTSRWTPAFAAVIAILVVFSWLWLVSSRSRSGTHVSPTRVEPGIAAELAAARGRAIQSLRYELSFSIPASQAEPVRGHEIIRFALRQVPDSLVLDFEPGKPTAGERILSVKAAGSATPFSTLNGHIVMPSSALRAGDNEIAIDFVAGDDPLNRNAEHLYSLFVPARAHLTFPCFDQPDLKARYMLSLEIPAGWEAITNGPELDRRAAGDRTTIRFAETEPLPTYLFAFAAGKFRIETAERSGRLFRMFHRETDAKKVGRNREAIFDLHAAALSWLEEYTAISYMFGKFDFVLIPSFQFSGMEHAGAVLYNASSLLLDQTATQDQQLARANTIAHETAHMWFGDLVTMRWFDDVWMKEVFANFFAAKIVNPSFPTLNHTLRFLVAHYPASYDIDRTVGANPIRQRLDNLRDAGSLYGNIIYDKAPIVMRQLEALIGEEAFKKGLRDYLKRYSFGNATWPDLIRILDDRTKEDLQAWSHAWVEEPGRPTIRTSIRTDAGRVTDLRFTQSDPRNRGLVWNQKLDVVLGYDNDFRTLEVPTNGPVAAVANATGLPAPRYVLPNGGAFGYGFFELDARSRRALLAGLPDIPDALTRGSAWVTLWDALLERHITPVDFVELELRALPRESDELTVQLVLAYLRSSYWRLLSEEARAHLAPRVEAALREGLTRARTTSLKAAYFSALRNVALTADTISFLERVWRRREAVPGLTLSENDESALALELAVREVPAWNAILQEQLSRIQNSDRRDRFAFAIPALSADVETRDRFFAGLRDVANRRHEPWVIDAVAYLNHPLRAKASEHYLRPSLDLLQEIQRTGDIFFPKRWLDATFNGHNSSQSAATVRDFLETHQEYPARLTQIILQSADLMFRAAAIANK
jgi:aminopeptidase N